MGWTSAISRRGRRAMSEPTLFDIEVGSYRRRDRATAKAAAAVQQPSDLEAEIVGVFMADDGIGLTDDQLCAVLVSRYAPTVKTARSRLAKRGILVDTGRRCPSNRGREMAVWRLS